MVLFLLPVRMTSFRNKQTMGGKGGEEKTHNEPSGMKVWSKAISAQIHENAGIHNCCGKCSTSYSKQNENYKCTNNVKWTNPLFFNMLMLPLFMFLEEILYLFQDKETKPPLFSICCLLTQSFSFLVERVWNRLSWHLLKYIYNKTEYGYFEHDLLGCLNRISIRAQLVWLYMWVIATLG